MHTKVKTLPIKWVF